MWILLALVGIVGTVFVLRALSRVAAAARELQRNVAVLSKHVNASIEQMGGDVQALGDSVDELRRK